MAAVALVALFGASMSVEDLSRKKQDLDVLYLPSGRFLEQISLGYRNLASDVLWLKTIQYYGGYRHGTNNLALFRHLVDVTTDLDPQFVFVYVFGALVIAQDLGYFEEGVAFLEKGMWNNPTEWWLPFEIGFINYVDARDYDEAARYFQLASRLPGADEITRRFAAFVASKAGHLETSIAMWEDLARTSENHYIRALAERYIEELKTRMHEQRSLER
jgi:tetratricopeptide (TPR) repeat protein